MRNNFRAGKILTDLAEKQGWTIEELAGILEIAPSNLYKKLKMNDLDTKFLRKAADAAGVDISRLFAVQVTQTGKFNTFGDAQVNYKSTLQNLEDAVLTEKVTGLEKENIALKQQIATLNKLVSLYESAK
ncbi:helix-turn-helix transcriptional regulator [Dyadobacter psychrotolerans]|uniref:XRE family transcriptional regulator n=1 Tax=Dyadobacter psychrotolerans TaxID=2541721 RepID=A0A4R5DW71_9BACT|nr:helix-turn-helix transcriptional regulator [Dyadobacter psychrotolerans]TDE15273.1 XRE family transcriptional regulator [Dyadobacter psychrotolerans]